MKKQKKWIVLVFTLLALIPLNLFAKSNIPSGLDSLGYDWGTIYFSPNQNSLAQSSAMAIQQTLHNTRLVLKIDRAYPFSVIIAPNHRIYRHFSHQLPEWAAGATDYSAQQIILKSPSLGKTDIWDYETTLRHEVAHIVIGQNINPMRLPRWLNEGLAMAIAGQHSMRQMYQLGQAVVRDDVIPLQQLEQLMTFPPQKATLGYAEAYSAVQYIQSEFPAETLPRVFHLLQNSNISYEQAFEKVGGISQYYFELHWRKSLTRQYNWITMFSSDTLFWLLFPLLAILGYLAIRWRNRRTLNRWGKQEEEIDKNSDWDYEYMPDEDEKWRGDIH